MSNSAPRPREVSGPNPRARQFLLGLVLTVVALTLLVVVVKRSQERGRLLEQQSLSLALQRQLSQQLSGMQLNESSALQQLQAEVERHPADTSARWRLADAYQKLGQIDKALPQIQAVVQAQPGSQPAKMALGNVYLALQRMKDAEATYRQMTDRWPTDADAWQGLAAALFHQQRYSEAVDAAQRAVELLPNTSNRYILASSAVQAAALFPDPGVRARQLLMSRNTLLHLLREMPDNVGVYYNLGMACAALRDPKDVEYLQKAYALAPGREDIATQLASAYIRAGKRDRALMVVQAALRRFPNSAPLYMQLGQILQFKGGADGDRAALAAFAHAAKLRPDDSFVLSYLGVSLLRNNHLNEARDAFLRSARQNRWIAFPYQQLAAIFARLGDTKKSNAAAALARQMVFNDQQLKQIEQLTEHYPGDWHLHLILADRFLEIGRYGPARDEYDVVGRLQPGNARAAAGIRTVDQRLAATPPQS